MARRPIALILFFILCLIPAALLAQPESPRSLDAAQLRLALKKLTVLGSVLYVGAHPDDENTAFLSFMAEGRLMRTAYLSMTRGEGGQNLIGSEQGELMGVIRTQELLDARRIDGAEQFFSRAIDFGYSKSLDETMRIWGKDRILADVVWVIRSFRPDVVVTRFTPTLGGHGNHTSSAALADEAFEAAGDRHRFPDQLKFVKPWKPKRLVWNVFRFQQSDRPAMPEHSISMDLGAYSPILGESFTEIAGRSRSMHKSQGVGGGQNRGEFVNYFQQVAGDSAVHDLFDGVNTTWDRVPGGKAVEALLSEAYKSFDDEAPAKSLPLLLRAFHQMKQLQGDPWVQTKKHDIVEAIKLCAGLWIDALSSENGASPGGEIKVNVTAINRSSYPFTLEKISGPFGSFDTLLTTSLKDNRPLQVSFPVLLPANTAYSQSYWLDSSHALGAYTIADQQLVGRPENPPSLVVKVLLGSNEGSVELELPVRFRAVDPVEGDQYRPFVVKPPVSVNVPEKVYVFADQKAKEIHVSVRNEGTNQSGSVSLQVPRGWTVQPPEVLVSLAQRGEAQDASFTVAPGSGAQSGPFIATANFGGLSVSQDMITIRYPHIPPQTVFPNAEGQLLRIDLRKTDRRVGYIMGPGDEIPAALKQLGYSVTLLTDDDLKNGSLSDFDVIIAGVRSYNTRPVLRANQRKLMEFVEKGGTYIVQYMTPRRTESENLGPYPFTVSGDRVSVEDAPVKFLAPENPVLNSPNKITQDDFAGWIQERGLYFANSWDPRYTAVLASHDPGEPSREGGLLIARYGKGTYVFTGYAFFRQLPAGVPGAYRLFVNLLSL